jgi:excinuclease ABC subunit C
LLLRFIMFGDIRMTLQEKLDQLPSLPGVYLYKDAAGGVLYVGKAASLRSRVRSYFQPGADLSARIRTLVSQVRDLDFIVAESEPEALALEFNLIQRYRPRFNVRYRDDKSYPYLRIDMQEEFPALSVVRHPAMYRDTHSFRRMDADGARYFGPYTSAWAMWQTVRLMQRIFKIRQRSVTSKSRGSCSWQPGTKPRARPCLNYHLGRCLGPCAGETSAEEYRRAVEQVCHFLSGKHQIVVDALRAEMEEASEALDFERAARLRDQTAAIEAAVGAQQRVVPGSREDADVLGYALQEDTACMAVMQLRGGRLIAQDTYLLEGVSGVPEAEVLNEFAKQHYQKSTSAPRVVYLPVDIEEAGGLAQVLTERRRIALGSPTASTRVYAPRRGEKRKLVAMAMENAQEHLRVVIEKESTERRRGEEAVADLQRALGLAVAPRRVEAYDISNLQGKAAVGSMIVFQGGHPRRSDYRRFRIRLGEEPNDYAMMHEVLSRRLKAAVSGNVKFATLPDLILVDGGPGQLNVAVKALADLDLSVPAAGLAKERELIFLPGREHPVVLPAHSRALHLLQRVRDEAHRFALAYHQSLRARQLRESVLDAVPGIGEARKRKLLTRFGSLRKLRQASVEEIAAAAGVSREVAREVASALAQSGA